MRPYGANARTPQKIAMSNRPNILFLMADQMQARVLDPDHVCQTPHLDRLAGEGVRFTRAYTPNNICSPTRASLMTGLMPHNHGVLGGALSQGAGFTCAAHR